MSEPRCAYFIADSHLGQGSAESNRSRERDLLAFFDKVHDEQAALYVNGDLFDFWFEYGHAIPKRFVRVLQALGDLRRRGVPVLYVGGNHDFWIGEYLARELDVPFSDVPVPLTLQGRRIFLAHGDGLGPGDHGYKVLKRVLRNRVARGLFRWIHPDIGIPLAAACSHTSRHHAPRPSVGDDDLRDRLAQPRYAEGYDAVVLGHFHRPIHWQGDGKDFLVLGDWVNRRTVVRLAGGAFQLTEFTST
ncbi:MAG TPA: UDP-2,3-diacylglucosamine diphosphatase [Candidatus Eisenbacteria bacterium]|jgi:UDP-2,3-diacylglucosamine hydrolase|nr:UDP-2,3-diacylglucosamine diphosphatase [Candidatus Eisenbacteria bacterium]